LAIDEMRRPLAGRILSAAWTVAWVWSLAFGVFASLGHNELLRAEHPETYRRLAHAGSLPGHIAAQWRSTAYGPLEMSVLFPKNQRGKYEPLVVTGVAFMSDYIYVRYTSDHTVSLGFAGPAKGGEASPEIPVDYDRSHVVRVEMGSLYPPPESRYFDPLMHAHAVECARRLRITLDGRVCLDKRTRFFDAFRPTPLIGCADAERREFGLRFTGTILAQTRGPSPKADASLPTGPLRLTLKLPTDRTGRNEPLLCTGIAGRGDLLYISYVDRSHITLTFDHWGTGGPTSAPVEIDYNAPQTFELNLGSLFGATPSGPLTGAINRSPLENRLLVRIGGHTILDAVSAFHPAARSTVQLATNSIGASICETEFSGEVQHVESWPTADVEKITRGL